MKCSKVALVAEYIYKNLYMRVCHSQGRPVKEQIYVTPCLQDYLVDESLNHLEPDDPQHKMIFAVKEVSDVSTSFLAFCF